MSDKNSFLKQYHGLMTDTYDKFYDMYKDILNIRRRDVPAVISPKFSPATLCSIPEHAFDETPWVDDKLINDLADPNNPTRIYTRDSKCEIPKDLKEFYKRFYTFPKINLEDLEDFKDCVFLPCDIMIGTDVILYPSPYALDNNAHYGSSLYIKDYYDILFDGHSVDNGYGRLYMNMNPKSKEYGFIYSFSSMDDGLSNLVCKSFTELMNIMISEAPLCYSICDCLNNYHHGECHREYNEDANS